MLRSAHGPTQRTTSKDKAAGVYHVYKAVSMVKGIQYHWTQQTDVGLCWVWRLKLRKSIWIIMKLHKIRTRFKVTIVLCPSLLKISLWRSEKKATEQLNEVNINRETNLPPYLTRVIPSDPIPGAGSVRITQDRWFLGSGSFVEPSFDPGSPRITQDRPDRVGRIVRGIGPWRLPLEPLRPTYAFGYYVMLPSCAILYQTHTDAAGPCKPLTFYVYEHPNYQHLSS